MHDGCRADGTGCTERVAEGDGAAERVDLARVEAEFLDHGERLGSEGFVQFDPVQVFLADAGLGQRLGDRSDRADAHDLRRHPADGEAGETGERRQVVFLEHLFRDQHDGGGTVRHLRGVASSH